MLGFWVTDLFTSSEYQVVLTPPLLIYLLGGNYMETFFFFFARVEAAT